MSDTKAMPELFDDDELVLQLQEKVTEGKDKEPIKVVNDMTYNLLWELSDDIIATLSSNFAGQFKIVWEKLVDQLKYVDVSGDTNISKSLSLIYKMSGTFFVKIFSNRLHSELKMTQKTGYLKQEYMKLFYWVQELKTTKAIEKGIWIISTLWYEANISDQYEVEDYKLLIHLPPKDKERCDSGRVRPIWAFYVENDQWYLSSRFISKSHL